MDTDKIIDVPRKSPRGLPNRLTEGDIENCLDGKSHKLADGGGLYISVDIQGNRYFQFRYFLNGKGVTKQLGTYPEMSLEKARALAKSRKAKVARSKDKIRDDSFDKDLKKRIAGDGLDDFYCFHSMEDAREFVRNLNVATHDKVINPDTGCLIFLSLLIPALPSELLSATRRHYNRECGIWEIPPPVNSKNANKPKIRVAFLSKKAMTLDLPGIVPSNILGNLFPRLGDLDSASVNKEIISALRVFWKRYPVKVEDFRFFFKAMATKNSLFKSKIIDDAVKHRDADEDMDRASYRLQRTAISEWWTEELIQK